VCQRLSDLITWCSCVCLVQCSTVRGNIVPLPRYPSYGCVQRWDIWRSKLDPIVINFLLGNQGKKYAVDILLMLGRAAAYEETSKKLDVLKWSDSWSDIRKKVSMLTNLFSPYRCYGALVLITVHVLSVVKIPRDCPLLIHVAWSSFQMYFHSDHLDSEDGGCYISLKFILVNLSSASGPGCGLEHRVHGNVLVFTTLLRHLLPPNNNVSRKDRGVNIRGGTPSFIDIFLLNMIRFQWHSFPAGDYKSQWAWSKYRCQMLLVIRSVDSQRV